MNTSVLPAAPLFALVAQPPVVARPERYGLVHVEGRDTVALERVSREHRTLRAEVILPKRARLLVTAQTDSLGCVHDADVQVFSWGSASNATAVQRVNVRLTGDSVRVDASARGVSQSVSRPGAGVRYVMAEESIAASLLMVECAGRLRARGADSVTVTTLAFPNLRLRQMRVYWRGDSVMLASTDTLWVRLDASGTATGLVLGRGRLVVHRVSATDIGALAGATRVASDYSAPAGLRTARSKFWCASRWISCSPALSRCPLGRLGGCPQSSPSAVLADRIGTVTRRLPTGGGRFDR